MRSGVIFCSGVRAKFDGAELCVATAVGAAGRLKRNGFRLNRPFALACSLSMIFSDLASPAEASNESANGCPELRAGGKPVPTFRDYVLCQAVINQNAIETEHECGGDDRQGARHGAVCKRAHHVGS